METDPVLSALLILLGAQMSYLLDEIFAVTPRVHAWLDRLFD